jgi:hypothetical protein
MRMLSGDDAILNCLTQHGTPFISMRLPVELDANLRGFFVDL